MRSEDEVTPAVVAQDTKTGNMSESTSTGRHLGTWLGDMCGCVRCVLSCVEPSDIATH